MRNKPAPPLLLLLRLLLLLSLSRRSRFGLARLSVGFGARAKSIPLD